MAISHIFDGKIIKLPGAYAATKALVSSPVVSASYSKVLIIDTGSNAGFAHGAGVNGEFAQGKNSIYRLRSAPQMRAFVKGGYYHRLAQCFFSPSRVRNTPGVTDIYFISASQTTAAVVTLPFTVGDLKIKVKDEGLYGNGVIDSTGVLRSGYGWTLTSGERDATKYILNFWIGTFTGNYTDGLPYDEVYEADALPQLVFSSPEVSTVDELVSWIKSNDAFGEGYYLVNDDVTGDITPEDLESMSNYVPALNGTEIYNSASIDAALAAIRGLDVSFIFSDNYGADKNGGVQSATNNRILSYINDDARFEMFSVMAGGSSKNEFYPVSIAAAKYYNTDSAWIIHGGCTQPSTIGTNKVRTWDALMTAALITGRIAGTQPQVPPTFKEIDVLGMQHDMDQYEKTDALDFGVLTAYYDEDIEYCCILKGINTLQNNNALVNPNGTSPSIAVRRISSQVNKEIIIDAKKELFTQRDGITILSLPESTVINWVKIKLKQKVDRGLITRYQDVLIERQEDAYYVSYKYQPNYEINFLFTTGFMLN